MTSPISTRKHGDVLIVISNNPPVNALGHAVREGLVKTDFARALWENPDTLKAVTRGTPLRRIGEPHEIAGAAVYLAAPASTFMTGQTIVVDGGSTVGVGL